MYVLESLACPRLGVLDTVVNLSPGGKGDTPPLGGNGEVPLGGKGDVPPLGSLGECPGVPGDTPGVTLGELCWDREKLRLNDGEFGGRGGGSLRLNSDTTLALQYENMSS